MDDKMPAYRKSSFTCPHCGVYAHQKWYAQVDARSNYVYYGVQTLEDAEVCYCTHCQKYSIWLEKQLYYPEQSPIPEPNEDLNEDIKDDYREAKSIVNKSPRGSAALLRLCIQKLCLQLGENGKNINDDIKKLVSKGLPVKIQKALDIVRVIGNEAVHPGQIDLKDDIQTATKLFVLINIISDTMITKPREIDLFYEALPETKKDEINKRDGKNTTN